MYHSDDKVWACKASGDIERGDLVAIGLYPAPHATKVRSFQCATRDIKEGETCIYSTKKNTIDFVLVPMSGTPRPSVAKPVPESSRPPLGVMPQKLWLGKRCEDLARAIHDYIKDGRIDQVGEWVEELEEAVESIGRTVREGEDV